MRAIIRVKAWHHVLSKLYFVVVYPPVAETYKVHLLNHLGNQTELKLQQLYRYMNVSVFNKVLEITH